MSHRVIPSHNLWGLDGKKGDNRQSSIPYPGPLLLLGWNIYLSSQYWTIRLLCIVRTRLAGLIE